MRVLPLRILILSAVWFGVLCCLAGRGQPAPPDEKKPAKKSNEKKEKTIVAGFSQIGAESDWRKAETGSVMSEALKRGVTLVFTNAQGKQESQIKAIRSFIASGVDAIVLAPMMEVGWEQVLKEARDAHIPVVLVDRGVRVSDDSLYRCLVASDFVEEGRKAARWLAKKTKGKADIVELRGTIGSAPAIERGKGFAEVVAKHPGMKIIQSAEGGFIRSKGKEVTEAMLKKHGNRITAVYAHNDDMALGAIAAIEQAGKKPGQDIIIVSIDGVRAAFEAILAGKLDCTVECSPLVGPYVFDAIEKILAGKPVPKKIIVHDEVFDNVNAPKAIDSRKY